MAVIETHQLTRSFDGRPALWDLDLDAHAGEVVALLGPNGAGKTTTVRLLNGILRPDRGRATVLGLDPAVDGDELRRRTGVLTENAGLDDRLTAAENLLAVAQIRGLRSRAAATRVDQLLERFGMGEHRDRRAHGFSTGQRKRVALARALLHDPDVLFLDEPTSGLDPEATRDVVDLIADLAKEHGRTVILCTHFLGEAGELADRMAVLHRGRLEAFGSPADLAAELWDGLRVDVDLGRPATDAEVATIERVTGVLGVVPAPTGAVATVRDRADLPTLTRAIVGAGIDVFASSPRPPTLEDVYFALAARRVDDPGLADTDTVVTPWPRRA